jgi:hypothetical protein
MTKARVRKNVGQEISTGVWESVRINIQTPKWTPMLGIGVLMESWNFREQLQREKAFALRSYLYHWKSYWSVDVQNGLAWPIWPSVTQVMAKRKAESQTGNLTPDHGKSRIYSIPLRAGGVQHAIGKLSMKATTSVQTPSQLEVCTISYSPAK